MSATEPTTPRRRGLLGRVWAWILGLVAALFATWVGSMILEWIGLTFFWPEQGAARSAAILRQDLAWLVAGRTEPRVLPGLSLPSPAIWALNQSANLYQTLLVHTGMEAILTWLTSTSALSTRYLEATLNTSQIFLVRLAISVTVLPLFVLCALWGALEGLIQRDLRRFGGDIERAMVYHWAKHVAGAVVVLPLVIYLAWPGSIQPAWVFVPFAAALGLNLWVMTSTFTKYV